MFADDMELLTPDVNPGVVVLEETLETLWPRLMGLAILESKLVGLPIADGTLLPRGGDLTLECDRLLVELYAEDVEKGDDNTVETAC